MNYIRIDAKSPFHVKYIYADRPKKYSRGVFFRNRIKVKETGVSHKEGDPYILVTCVIKKWDEKKFLEALEDLEGTLIRMGHSDYSEWCEKWISEETGLKPPSLSF